MPGIQGDLNPQEKKYAVVNTAGADSDEIVAAVTGKKIRVLSYVLAVSGATTLIWHSASTPLTGAMQFVGAVSQPFSSGYNPAGHFETVAGEALNLESSGAVDADGHISYIEV